jgi:hypothetical protein
MRWRPSAPAVGRVESGFDIKGEQLGLRRTARGVQHQRELRHMKEVEWRLVSVAVDD